MDTISDQLISTALNQDIHPILSKEGQIFYLLNGDIAGMNSEEYSFVQNTNSNEVCYCSPLFKGSTKLTDTELIIFEGTGNTSQITLLNTETCTSKVLFKDPCLNFQDKIESRFNIVCGERIIYFGNKNRLQEYNVDKCPNYKRLTDCQDCEDIYIDELDCEALNLNKHINLPCLELKPIQGQIECGVYQVAIKLNCEYFPYPELIKLFDKKNRTQGVAIQFTECFTTFYDTFELVLISHTESGTIAYKIEELDTSTKQYYITSLENAEVIDTSLVFQKGVYYQGFEHIAKNADSLILGNPCFRKEFDYRVLVQDICIKPCIISVTPEEAHLYPSLMRDEVYPFEIAWRYPDGQIVSRTHIPSLCTNTTIEIDSITYNMTDEAPANDDHYEVCTDVCDPTPRKIFEIYNNGTIDYIPDWKTACKECSGVKIGDGKMSYWESQEKYPNDYPILGCQPIRHHKMPDNCVAPITTSDSCSSPCINILTVQIDNIHPPLDCDGNGIEGLTPVFYIGDRTNHKGITSKGLLFNMGIDDKDDCKDVLYPNFPFNDLKPNKYLADGWIKGPLQINRPDLLDQFSREYFTYHSPDHTYVKGQQSDTLQIYNEAIGKVQGTFHETKDHPKHQILSGFGEILSHFIGLVEGYLALNAQKCITTTETCTTRGEIISNSESLNITESATEGATVHDPYVITSSTTSSGGVLISTTTYNVPEHIDGHISVTEGLEEETTENIQQAQEECNPVIFGISMADGPNGTCIVSFTVTDNDGAPLDNKPVTMQASLLNAGTFDPTYEAETYIGQTDSNGNVSFTLASECSEYNTITEEDIDVDCCLGDKTTSTTVEECEDRMDIINNILPNFPGLDSFPTTIYYYMQGQAAARNFLQSLLKPKQYAIQYTAEACFDNHDTECRVGNRRRDIAVQQPLEPINQIINDQYINNWCRSSSELLCLTKELLDPINQDCSRVLHSDACNCLDFGFLTPIIDLLPPPIGNIFDNLINCNTITCSNSVEFPYCSVLNEGGTSNPIQAVSYYVATKNYKPSQYGQLNDYITREIPKCGEFLLAGDIYISKHSVRRKMPLWNKLPLGLPNNTEFDTRDNPNVGCPTYWLNTSNESIIEQLWETLIGFGNWTNDSHLDNVECLGQCLNPVAAFFNSVFNVSGTLGVLGDLLTFLTALPTGNFVNPLKQIGVFYTHVTGVVNYWAESEFQADFRECNELEQSNFYPNISLEDIACATEYHLPEQFLYNLKYNWKGIHKQQSYVENPCCLKEKSLIAYSTDDWSKFEPLSFQEFDDNLTVIKEIDDGNLFLGFEDSAYVTQYDDSILTQNGQELRIGSPNAFQKRLRKISSDVTGYGGVIDPDAVIMSRFGLIYPDRKRKKWLLYNGELTDISNSMSSWFKCHMNGEIIGVWDNCSNNYYFTDKDTGWTLSFKPTRKDWISFHSFIPDSYINLDNNFLSYKEGKLWKHNIKCKFQQFYGKTHRFEVGVLIQPQLNTKLSSLKILSEWYECKGYDCKIYHRDKFFDEIFVYNNCSSTNIQPLKLRGDKDKKGIKGPSVINEICDQWLIKGLCDNQSIQPYTCREDNGWEYSDQADNETGKSLSGRWFKIHLRSNLYPDVKKVVELVTSKTIQNKHV